MIIKPILETAAIKAVAGVEAETWGMGLADTVPDHVLTAIARDGGVLLGAYEDQRLVGFTLGWLGTVDPFSPLPAAGQLKLVSHMTGVLPEYRDRRVGFELKLAQRNWARERGVDLVTWTYDPLESRNGYFNIHLLACTCQTYLRDYYGEMSDQMNAGQVPSDRFRVDWWIDHPRVQRILEGDQEKSPQPAAIGELMDQGLILVNPARKNDQGIVHPAAEILPGDEAGVLVEIPSDMQAIRREDQGLAFDWRVHTRTIFEDLFAEGFRVVDFHFLRHPYPRSFYHLEKSHEN